MITQVTGIVIKEYIVGESDKFITLFTKEMGKIQVGAPKAKKFDRGLASGTQMFVYGEFLISGYKDTYKLLSVEVKHMFHQLSEDLLALSYASYVIEFISEVATESGGNEKLLSLALHTLHRLTKKNTSLKLTKCVFEMRAMTVLGFMLELERCIEGHEPIDYEKQSEYVLNIEEGGMMCNNCVNPLEKYNHSYKVNEGLWYALRFMIYSSDKDAFKFDIEETLLKQLTKLCDGYVGFYIEKSFKSLLFIQGIENL